MESGLVLLGKDGPEHSNKCDHSDTLKKITWYFEMIVKSAALSSNQAVGVKKSLDIHIENQAAGV